jgi:alkylation response protein AidB-like acyl-CoA dehydrogenase
MVEVFRHAGRFNLNFRDVVGGAHVRPLLKSKSPEVLDIVSQVAKGQAYIAIAITEPDVGSDVPSIMSTSRKVEGGYLLTGTKRFNARLEQATHVILFTQGTTGEPGKLSVFIVPIATPGLKIEHLIAHGLTGNSFGGLSFKDLFVPGSHRIGEDGNGLNIFREHFLYWRLMQSAAAIGCGEDALQQMADRIKARQAFGGPIGRFTHLQQPIGQYKTELLMANAFARDIAEMLDRGEYRQAQPLICGLKAEGVENALHAVDAAARAFGGEGYSTLVDIGDRLQDLNGLRIADGTTDVMRMEVVRHIYGKEFWNMAVESESR